MGMVHMCNDWVINVLEGLSKESRVVCDFMRDVVE
jgi:hypothetical protein